MNIEFIKNPDTGILEAWEDGSEFTGTVLADLKSVK